MKRIAVVGLVVLLGALSGCSLINPADPPIAARINRLSEVGVIHAPLIDGGPFGYCQFIQPGALTEIDFRTGCDQYGDRTGLGDDMRWRIHEVVIELPEKRPQEDDVFWPRGYPENVCVWFPGWKGPLDPFSNLPYSMEPMWCSMSVQPIQNPVYPWNSCMEHHIDAMPAQVATMSVSAMADWVHVELILRGQGTFLVEWPGTPLIERASAGVITKRLGEPGIVVVTCSDGEIVERTVPVSWFWCDEVFFIDVGPSGECR